MKQLEAQEGHNSFVIKTGDAYNVTFDADTKKALAKARDNHFRAIGVVIKANAENMALRQIVHNLTGVWVEDPAEYLAKMDEVNDE